MMILFYSWNTAAGELLKISCLWLSTDQSCYFSFNYCIMNNFSVTRLGKEVHVANTSPF